MAHAHSSSRLRLVFDWLLIASFLGGCAAPLACSLSGWQPGNRPNEKRRASIWPAWQWSVRAIKYYPQAFEAFHNDHFGLRATLLRWNGRLRVNWLGVSSSQKVVLGRDGWLYYDGDGAMADHRGESRCSEEELWRMQRGLEARRDWLARRHCEFFLVIAPNKETIYPEHLPSCIPHGRTRLDRLAAHLARHSDLRVLDLRPVLHAAKSGGTLYSRTDSHWNPHGALIAYSAIMRALPGAGHVAPRTLEDFNAIAHPDASGDLAAMLAVDRKETIVSLVPRHRHWRSAIVPDELARLGSDMLISQCESGELPAAIIIHDSFAEMLLPYLAEHFQRLVSTHQHHFPIALLERERPRLVIQEVVERFVGTEDAWRPPEN